jgi:hypothetical protein
MDYLTYRHLAIVFYFLIGDLYDRISIVVMTYAGLSVSYFLSEKRFGYDRSCGTMGEWMIDCLAVNTVW